MSAGAVSEEEKEWIGGQEIEGIEGALKTGAYVARAYRYARENGGHPPDWARKLENGHWLFSAQYVTAEARRNSETIGISEAAKKLGATRRAVQTWVDEGVIPAAGERGKNEPRQILKKAFIRNLQRLRKRLATSAAVGQRIRYGKPVSEDAIERVEAEKAARETAARERKSDWQRERREDIREAELAEQAEAELEAAVEAGQRAAREVKAALKEVEIREAGKKKAAAAEAGTAARLRAEIKAAREARLAAAGEWRAAINKVRLKEAEEKKAAAVEAGLKAVIEAQQKKVREKRAAAIEAGLKEAREARLEAIKRERRAVEIAERIADDMFDNRLTRIHAMLLFDRTAASEGVPDDIRTKVRKKFFGK